jgi:hypothetical protein
MTTTTMSIESAKRKLLRKTKNHVGILPDPDMLGTAEYRAIYELVQGAIDDADLNCETGEEFIDLLLSELYEVADTAVALYRRIAVAFDRGQIPQLVDTDDTIADS